MINTMPVNPTQCWNLMQLDDTSPVQLGDYNKNFFDYAECLVPEDASPSHGTEDPTLTPGHYALDPHGKEDPTLTPVHYALDPHGKEDPTLTPVHYAYSPLSSAAEEILPMEEAMVEDVGQCLEVPLEAEESQPDLFTLGNAAYIPTTALEMAEGDGSDRGQRPSSSSSSSSSHSGQQLVPMMSQELETTVLDWSVVLQSSASNQHQQHHHPHLSLDLDQHQQHHHPHLSLDLDQHQQHHHPHLSLDLDQHQQHHHPHHSLDLDQQRLQHTVPQTPSSSAGTPAGLARPTGTPSPYTPASSSSASSAVFFPPTPTTPSCQSTCSDDVTTMSDVSTPDAGSSETPRESFVLTLPADDKMAAATLTALETCSLTPLIKEELKYTIQSRRLAAGKPELVVDASPKAKVKRVVMTPEEKERAVKRRQQNRVAAQRFRQKQRDTADVLAMKCQRLDESNDSLRGEIRSLAKESEELKQLLLAHLQRCPKVKVAR